jgi:hypothetical protein
MGAAALRPWAARLAAVAALLAGAFLSVGAPQLTAQNAGLSVAYPWPRGAGALLAALGAAGLALTLRQAVIRALAALLAVVSLWASLHLFRYRVQTDAEGLSARGAWGTRRVAWRALTEVVNGPGVMELRAGGQRLLLDVADFRPEDRATLDRIVARRVREASPR